MNKIIEKLQDKNIAILGFGKEGYSTYKYLRKHLEKQKITIIDKNVNLRDNYDELNKDSNLNFVLGDNYLENLNIYDIIIKSPGVSIKDLNIETEITSQMELALNSIDSFTIGITGTKGKSTTSSLIYKVLKDQNKDVYLVGNIGNPILDYIDLLNHDSILVIEFSAHQLLPLKKSPNIGIILNLFEEHLDFFGNLDSYYSAKLNIFKYQNQNDYSLFFEDNYTLVNYMKKYNLKSFLLPISLNDNKKICIYSDNDFIYKKENNNLIKLYNLHDKRNLIGRHNAINIMFVLGVVSILKLDQKIASKSINDFNGLNHRLQNIGIFKDIIFFNDTIATIPDATLNGINSLEIVDTLIFGGMDRGIDYSNFANELNKTSINNFICMPDTGYKIGKELERIVNNKNIYFVEELEEAVKLAYDITGKGKICLLSPAAPSYNKYKNFEDKGQKYIDFVKKYSE